MISGVDSCSGRSCAAVRATRLTILSVVPEKAMCDLVMFNFSSILPLFCCYLNMFAFLGAACIHLAAASLLAFERIELSRSSRQCSIFSTLFPQHDPRLRFQVLLGMLAEPG